VHGCLYWNGTPSGGFTVKSAMKIIRLQGETHQDKAWHIAWKLPVSQRVGFFIWRALHDKVTINAIRVKRQMTVDASFPCCGNYGKTLSHLLGDCDFAH